MGLAYPGITSEYQGTVPAQDSNSAKNNYNPIFTTMYQDGLSSAMFSMAIMRGTNGGYMSFGGMPPVTYGTVATTPIQVTNLAGYAGSGTYMFYSMTPDAIVYKGAPASQSDQWIVDSGTTLIYAPTNVAAQVAQLFSPPAQLNQGLYQVSCTAQAPSFGVKIGGQTFSVNATDLLLNNGGSCILGVQDGGSGPFILGDVFMKNVVVSFDVGAGQLGFATHTY
jgi:Eukaryotic aspartyl protease